MKIKKKPEPVTKVIIIRMFYLDILTASERDLDQPISIYVQIHKNSHK